MPAWLCLLLLLTACAPAVGTNPGIKVRLTRRALEFGGSRAPDHSWGNWAAGGGGTMPRWPGMGDGGVSWTRLLAPPAPQPLPWCPPPNPRFAPGRQFGLELLQSLLQKEQELNLNGSYYSPLVGTLTYAVPR